MEIAVSKEYQETLVDQTCEVKHGPGLQVWTHPVPVSGDPISWSVT